MGKTKEWFGVKSIYCYKKENIDYFTYEERVVMFLAIDFYDAIEQAEIEANKYCINDKTIKNTEFYDAYKIFDEEILERTEVYSKITDSKLDIKHYLDLHYPE